MDNSETASVRSSQKTSADVGDETQSQSQQPLNLSLSSLEELTADLMRRVLGNDDETDTPATTIKSRATTTEVRFGNTVSIIAPPGMDAHQNFLPFRYVFRILTRPKPIYFGLINLDSKLLFNIFNLIFPEVLYEIYYVEHQVKCQQDHNHIFIENYGIKPLNKLVLLFYLILLS